MCVWPFDNNVSAFSSNIVIVSPARLCHCGWYQVLPVSPQWPQRINKNQQQQFFLGLTAVRSTMVAVRLPLKWNGINNLRFWSLFLNLSKPQGVLTFYSWRWWCNTELLKFKYSISILIKMNFSILMMPSNFPRFQTLKVEHLLFKVFLWGITRQSNLSAITRGYLKCPSAPITTFRDTRTHPLLFCVKCPWGDRLVGHLGSVDSTAWCSHAIVAPH